MTQTNEENTDTSSVSEETVTEHQRAVLKYTPSLWLEHTRPELSLQGAWKPVAALYDDLAQRIVLKKGAQGGGTEFAISRAIQWLDLWGVDVLYLFPTQQNASEFSAGRFDPILKKSQYLRRLFTDVNNVHHKRAGFRNFYCRGSNSEAQLVSIPVAGLIIDEFDRMDLDNLSLARDRVQGQKEWYEINLSTPTFPGMGIDTEYQRTDQKEFLLPCTNCQEHRPLSWNSLSFRGSDYTTAHWRCSACGKPWTEQERLNLIATGSWVAQRPDEVTSGYHLPALLSPVRKAMDFAKRYAESEYSETALQHFHNSVLGESYAPEGTRFSPEIISACQSKEPYKSSAKGERCVMGVDVGRRQHIAIVKPLPGGRSKILKLTEVPELEDIKPLLIDYDVRCCVIDMLPETQKAREIQREWKLKRFNSIWLATYPNMKGSIRWNNETGIVDLARTEAIDHVLARMKSGSLLLPVDMPRDVHQHLRNVVRINEEDKRTGNLVARWRDTGPDHYLHALVYCESAALRVPATSKGFVTWL